MDSARRLLEQEFGSDLRTPEGDDVVLLEERVAEYDSAWLVPFNSRAYITTGDPVEFLLPGACLVPKDEAVHPHFPPTHLPVDEYLEKVRAGEMSWAV